MSILTRFGKFFYLLEEIRYSWLKHYMTKMHGCLVSVIKEMGAYKRMGVTGNVDSGLGE